MTEEEKTATLPSDVSDFLGMGQREAGGIGDSAIRPPSFAGGTDDFDERTKNERRARFKASADMLFSTDVSKLDDEGASALYQSVTEGLFGLPDEDGTVAFGKRASKDPRANIDMLRKFVKGDYTLIEDPEYTKWRQMDEDAKFQYAREQETTGNKIKSNLKGERGFGISELAGAGMPGAQFGNVFQNMEAPNKSDVIRRTQYETLTDEEKAAYRADVIGDYEEKLSRRQTLATFLQFAHGLSDRAGYLLAKSFSDGTPDAANIEGLPEEERDRVYAAFSLMRGDQKKGRILGIQTDFTDDTVANRLQLGLYGFQQSVVGLVTDTGEMVRDAALWTYAKTAMDEQQRKDFFNWWDGQARAEQAMKQSLPEASGIVGEAFQGLSENLHWFIPYSMIGKGGKMVNAARGLKGEQGFFKGLVTTLRPMRLGGALKEEKATLEAGKAAMESTAAATRAAWTLDVNGVKKLGDMGSAILTRQMAAVDRYTQMLRGVEKDLEAAKWWKDAAGTAMWAAGEASAFSAFASEYIANADAAGISREESVLTAAAVGLVNAKIEQLYVPGLESSLTPAQVKSLTFAAMAQAIKTDGAAGFRKWLANRVSKGVTEGVKVTLTEGAVEEPLQQMAVEHGKAFDKLCQELRKDGKATLANEAKALWDSFAATLPNDYATFIDTAADMVPSSLGFGVTTIGNMTRRQHVHNVLTRHANRRAGSTSTMMTAQTMQELQGATDYDAGLVDVIQQAVNVRTAVEKHWQGEEDGGEAKNPHRFEEAITAARRAWRDPQTGDAVQEIADAAGVDVKTAEVLAQYLQTEAEATAFSPQARAWTSLNMSLADIDEETIKTVLPGYVEGSFASDPENGIYSGRVKMDDGTEKTIAYRVGDISAELMAEAQNMAKADSSFGKSFDARHAEAGDGVTWASLSDAQRYAEAVRAQASVNGFSTGKSGVFELTDSKGEKVRVNADDIIYLANGRIGDIGYGPAATQGTVRHETFHSLWRFIRGTLADADVQQLAKTLGIDITKDGWEVTLDERMAHEMERYASGHYVSHAVSSRFDKMLDSWAGKIINFFGQFGPSDEVTDPKTGKPYQLKGLYDSILRGELGSGTLGVELRKVPQQTAERTATPKSSMPVEVTDADRAAQEAEAQAEADESAEADEKVVQPQSPKTQGQNATVDESGATAPKVVHTAENPADAATPNQRYYKVGLPNSQVKLVGRLEVRDAESGVITSTDADYHDRGNQNRDDKSEESRALVEKIGANPDPLQIGTVQPIASNGIVWMLPNGDVIIGNHRVNGVRLGYAKGTASELEKFVREDAAKRGIEIGADVKKPLLVFVLERIESPDGKADVHEVVRLANESQNRGFNVREQAGNDAKILTDNNLLPRMEFRADGRIDETKSGDAIGKFRQETGAQGLIAEDGSLTEEGQTRIQNAALAALLGGEGNNALLQKIMENAGRLDMQGELRALMKMTPELMALAEAKPAYDLRAPLAEALQLFTEWRDKDETSRVEKGKTRHDWREMKDGRRVRGLSWEAFMSQGDMFRQPSDEAKILGDLFAKAEQLRSFDREDVESAAGKKRVIDLISDYLTDYIGNARAVNTDTEDMFGGTPATRAEVMAAQRATGGEGSGPRFSVVSDKQTLDRLNGETTVKVYRAMQYVDGVGLLPPMAAKVDGKWNSPAQIGDWLQADERPDLVKDGKFTLNKGNGASIKAAYNPYFHTSRSPLNDQFSSAYKRPNLVTVEVEVPESELKSGYRAEGAKDAVGEMSWHAGPVSSKLPAEKTRKVILSRWAKIVRVVPDSEVADRIAEMLDGEGISVPANTVTPSLRAELEKRGVRIEYTPEVIAQNIDELLKNFAAAKGKTTDEIFKTFSHDLLAVGQLPPNNNLPAELKVLDPTVRTSENYLLDHIYNHQHEKVYSEADVRRVLSLIGVNTEARIVRQRGSSSIAFVGANPGGGWDCIVVAPRRGQFYIFKTMFGQNRKPYQDKPMARFSVSGSSVRDNAVVSLLRGPLASIRDVDRTANMIPDFPDEGKRYSIAAKPAGKNKSANVSYPDAGEEISSMRFSIGTKRRDEYSRLLAKHRPDLRADAILDELDKYDNPKKEKLTLHWIVRGTIWLPYDERKVDQAIEVAEKAKVDPFKYASPLALIDAHSDIRPTEKRIDPATVPELTDARDEGNGVVSYAVQDDRAGQAAMRRIIDTHWGKDANPWCLLARGNDASPEVMRAAANLYPGDPDAQSAYIERQKKRDDGLARAWEYWNHYNALPKRVAFKDGKLLAFMATEGMDEDQAFDDAAYGGGGELARRMPDLYAEYEQWQESEEGQEEGANFYQWLEHEHYDELREALDNPSEEWWDRQDESHIGHDGLMEIAGAKGGIRYSIVGEQGAEKFGIGKKTEAEAMENAGADRRDIWRKTGWWRAKDGKWRFEMPDPKTRSSKEIESAFRLYGESMPLEEIVSAPELFKAYPELALIDVKFDWGSSGALGRYDPQLRRITLWLGDELAKIHKSVTRKRERLELAVRRASDDGELKHYVQNMDALGIKHGTTEAVKAEETALAEELRRDIEAEGVDEFSRAVNLVAGSTGGVFPTLVHEIQHVIQQIEGFAKGGNPETIRRARDNMNRLRRDIFGEMDKAGFNDWILKQDLEALDKRAPSSGDFRYFKQFVKEGNFSETQKAATLLKLQEAEEVMAANREAALEGLTPEEGYTYLAGEVEARNVERRLGRFAKMVPPWMTEDVPADRQIVRYSLAPNPNLREDIAAALRKNAGGDDTTVQMKRHDEIVFSDNLPFFEFLGLPNVKVVTDVVKVRKFNIKHHLSEDQIAELPYRYNAPVAVMKDGTDGYVLLTDLMAKDDHDNDKPVMVYLRRKERPSGEVIFIATAFAKNAEDEAEYYGPLMKSGLLFADENKIAGLALGEETESILRTQASGDHVLTSSDYSWWSTRISITQSSADRNGLSTPAQLLAAVAKGSAKRKEEQQKSQGESRYSTDAPRSGLVYPQLRGMSDEELVSAAVAARIALGKSDKVSDRSVRVTTVQNMMRRLHPDWDTTKIGVESQRVMTGAQKLAKRIRDDLGRGVSDSLVLEHLPTAMREQFGREMRQEAREGARLGAFGVRANTALEERQAKIIEDAVRVQTGIDSGAIENAYGINLSETIMHLAENPLTEKDAPQGTAGEGEGSADEEGAASAEESEEAAVEIDAKVKAVVDDIVSASGQQAGTDEQNRKNRKAAAGRDAENEAAMGEGEEGAEAEGASSGEGSDGDALAEAVKKSALDLENPRHLARFVAELARRQWIKEHGLAKDADVWRDLVAVQFLRKTAQSVYAKLVRDLTYSRSRETAMGRIAKLDNVPTVAGLLSEMEFLGALINAQRIRDKQKSMCEKLDLFLRQEFGAQGRFKPDKEEGKRKVSAEAELRARYMRHAMWLTPDAAAEEARQLQETLDALSVDFKDAGRDRDQSREFVETIRKLNVLREFGALRYKPVGEIEAAVQWWQDFARGESDDIVREMSDRDIRTKKAAHLLAVAFADPKRTTIREGGKADALNRFITGHMGFISLLQDCMRHASDADAAAVKDIIDYISREVQKAGDRSEAEKRRHNDAFHSAVESIYGKSFNAVMKAMMAPDERFTKYMGVVGGKRVTPTKGRALQLLVSLLQEGRKVQVEDEENPGQTKTVWEGGYHDNIVKHHREGQAAEIMRLLTPQDMNMLKWLGQWYENNRADLSGVCHSLFGIGVYAELPNYFPVKMQLETQGLEKGNGVSWTIFPKALTPRVRNERDFDTSADIFSMWASRMEEAAQWKHHARLGMEMRGIFGRAELREAVRANHGAAVDDLMQGFITDILAGHGAYDRSTAGVQYFSDQIRGWTALCALGGNIGVMAKQTTSIPAFGFEIGLVNTAKYIVNAFTPEGMAAMGKIWDSEQRRTRWNLGSSEAVRNALSQQNASWLKRALQKSMITTKLGDVVPALVVGQGIYRDCLDRGMSEEDAMAETWSIIERTQQSGRMENQTSIQRRNKLGRIMFQFLSTQQQYLQYEMRAIREVIARPDSVKRWGNLGRAILLNHFILSSAYYWVGQLYKYALGQEPPEDELKDWLITCLLGPYGSLFVAGFCCKYTLERAIKGYSIKGGSSMLPMESWLKNQVNDGAKLLEAIFDSDGDTWDNMLDAAGRWMSDSNSVVRDLRKIYRYRVKGEQQKK